MGPAPRNFRANSEDLARDDPTEQSGKPRYLIGKLPERPVGKSDHDSSLATRACSPSIPALPSAVPNGEGGGREFTHQPALDGQLDAALTISGKTRFIEQRLFGAIDPKTNLEQPAREMATDRSEDLPGHGTCPVPPVTEFIDRKFADFE
jgi:hypothetical protein